MKYFPLIWDLLLCDVHWIHWFTQSRRKAVLFFVCFVVGFLFFSFFFKEKAFWVTDYHTLVGRGKYFLNDYSGAVVHYFSHGPPCRFSDAAIPPSSRTGPWCEFIFGWGQLPAASWDCIRSWALKVNFL